MWTRSHYSKDFPNSADPSPGPDQNMSVISDSPLIIVTHNQSNKLTTILKTAPIKRNPIGKETVCFITKSNTKHFTSNHTNIKMVAPVLKPNPIMAAIDIQDDNECVVFSIDDNAVTLTED